METDEESQTYLHDLPTLGMSNDLPIRRSDVDASSILATNGSFPGSFPESPGLDVNQSFQGLGLASALPSNPGEEPHESARHPASNMVPPEVEQRPQTGRLKRIVERIIAINKSTQLRVPSRSWIESNLVPEALPKSPEDNAATPLARDVQTEDVNPAVNVYDLRPAQPQREHTASVKHTQFSPNGDFLATCGWDRTAIIWKVGETVELSMKLYHPVSTGGFVNQVVWSPDGSKLLTRTQRAIKVWDPRTGTSQRTISRGRSIQSVSWMPSGNGFLSVEYKTTRSGKVTDTRLVRLDNNGQVIETFTLERIQIWDTAIMEDESRIVAVGTLIRSRDDLQPTAQSRAEKRLLVYNLKTREIEYHVPLLQEVRSVSLCSLNKKTTYALVSHEDKSPPQMWRIDMKKGIGANEQVTRLILIHAYLTKSPVDFVGQGFFGGPNDSFVCCSSKSGEIYIWDRRSATLLRTLPPGDSEVIKSFTCNRKAGPGFMLVSGALDGALRTWAAPPPIATPSLALPPESEMPGGSTAHLGRGGSVEVMI